jgi:hypothetical protein
LDKFFYGTSFAFRNDAGSLLGIEWCHELVLTQRATVKFIELCNCIDKTGTQSNLGVSVMDQAAVDKFSLAMIGAYVWVASSDEGVSMDEYTKFHELVVRSPFASQLDMSMWSLSSKAWSMPLRQTLRRLWSSQSIGCARSETTK